MADYNSPIETLTVKKQRKVKYRQRMEQYLAEYKNILIISIDYVGSNQLQQVRLALRNKATILMGKNTIMRKVLRDNMATNPDLEKLIPLVIGNMGMVFTNDNLAEIRKIIIANKVPAAAKAGIIAPDDVFVPAGPTGLDPGQTNFFQALNIGTKIARGAIEIVSRVHLIREGEKVTSSAVALLSKLNIRPFFFGIKVTDVYEAGQVYSANVLDITDEDMLAKWYAGVRIVAALSLAAGYPTEASVSHSIMNGFKVLVAVCLETEYCFEEAKEFKDLLNDPEALAKLQAAAAAAAAGPAVEEEAPAKEESSSDDDDDDDEGFSLFD